MQLKVIAELCPGWAVEMSWQQDISDIKVEANRLNTNIYFYWYSGSKTK